MAEQEKAIKRRNERHTREAEGGVGLEVATEDLATLGILLDALLRGAVDVGLDIALGGVLHPRLPDHVGADLVGLIAVGGTPVLAGAVIVLDHREEVLADVDRKSVV